MAGVTVRLLDAVAATGAGATFNIQRAREERGGLHVWSTVTSFTLQIQGRSDLNAPWCPIATYTNADLDAQGCIAALVALMPDMRANCTAMVAGGGTLSVALFE
jgi:hypothetical protein